MTTNHITRAQDLAARRGVATKAKTLRGLLAALRKRGHTATKPLPGTTTAAKRRCYYSRPADLAALISGHDQGRARTRTHHPFAPLAALISAALGVDVTDTVPMMPNNYRGAAEASYAASARIGKAVLIQYGRATCGKTSYGGSSTMRAAPSISSAIHRDDALKLLPRLPAGYRWGADNNGPRIIRISDGADYHPTTDQLGYMVSAAFQPHDIIGWITTLAENAERRLAELAGQAATKAAEDEFARSGYVCRSDSLRAGNCAAGTDAWIKNHGLDPLRHYPARAVRAIADSERVRIALRNAARRHAAEIATGVCQLADHGL